MTQPPSEPEATRPEDQPTPEPPSPGFPSTPPQEGGYSRQGGYGPPPQAPDGPPPGYGRQGGSSQGFPPPAPGGYGPPTQGGYGAPSQGFPPPNSPAPQNPPAGYGAPGPGQPGSFQKQPDAGPGQYPPPAPGGYGPPPTQGGYGDAQGFAPPAQGGYGTPPPGYGSPQPGYGPPQGFPPPAGNAGPSLPPIDISKVGNGDWVVLGLGVLLLIFSFFGWWSYSFNFVGVSQSLSFGGWNRFWWIAPLLILAITLVRAAQLLTGLLVKEVKPLWLLYAAVVAVVVYLISLIDIFTYSNVDGADDLGAAITAGPGFGIWASIILSLAFVYFLALSLQARGEKLPVAVPGPKL